LRVITGTSGAWRGQISAWWYIRRSSSPRRWARRLGIEHELATLATEPFTDVDIFEYLFAREAGLTREQVIGLWLDRVDVEPVSAAVRFGLDPTEALLTSRLELLDLDAYAAARRAGVGLQEAIDLHKHGVNLDVYGAVKHHTGINDQASGASAAGVCGLGYRICRAVGLSHEQIMQLHTTNDDLWTAARDHRRRTELPDDDFDKFLARVAANSRRWNCEGD